MREYPSFDNDYGASWERRQNETSPEVVVLVSAFSIMLAIIVIGSAFLIPFLYAASV